MGKQILYGADARAALLKGVNAVANAVKTTLGPAGRNAILYTKYDAPLSTRDGVTVAKSIDLDDPSTDAGCQIIKQASEETAENAGDGTTTSIVLAQAIYTEGIKSITAQSNSVSIKRGIDKAVDFICKKGGELDKHSRPVIGDAIIQVATISANNDLEMGTLIAEALRKAGADGVITVEESGTLDTSLENVEGMKLNSGFISPYFINNAERQECVLEDCYLLIVEARLGSKDTILPILELVAKSGKPLFVIAEDVEGEVVPLLVVNKIKGTLNSCAVKAPGVGNHRKELLNDIATLAGGRAILQDLGATPASVQMSDLGKAKKIIITKSSTTIIVDNSHKEVVNERIKGIRTQMSLLGAGQDYERDGLQERLAKLSGGVSIIKVGAASQVEMSEKKGRIEDALFATKAAVEEGIVPGGGVTLARLSSLLNRLVDGKDEAIGVKIVQSAMLEPLKCIAHNAGQQQDLILKTTLEKEDFEYGYNALTNKFEDLIAAGVLDPTKVVRTALQNAGSVAGTLLTTETLVVEEVEEKSKSNRLPGR